MSTSQEHSAEGSSGAELCRDRTFPTKHLSYLPRVYQLSPLSTVRVDYARVDQLDVCRQFIQQAADRGDNVGTDEYDDELDFVLLFGISELFVATELSSPDAIKAFVAIQPCLYTRGPFTCVATVHVFRSADIADDHEAYRSLVRLGVHLTSQIELGYTVVVAHATLACPTIMRALRAEGFGICAILPKCIDIAGVGLQENVVLMKNLGLPDCPPKSHDDIIAVLNRFISNNLPEALSPLPTYDFLPRDYVFRCGLHAVIRNAVEDDVQQLFELMNDASEHGEGYSLNEYPTLDYFRRLLLAYNPCVVYELKSNGDMIGFSIFGDSYMSRTKIGAIGDTDTLVSKRYRSIGVGREVTELEVAIMKQTGRTAGINDTMISNDRMLKICRTAGLMFLGTIPKAAYRPATGEYEETVIDYWRFDNVVVASFSQLADANAAQRQQGNVTSKL